MKKTKKKLLTYACVCIKLIIIRHGVMSARQAQKQLQEGRMRKRKRKRGCVDVDERLRDGSAAQPR